MKREKDKFERKLSDMNGELKKLQAARKEHAKLLRNQSHYEKQLSTMTRDLNNLKRLKVSGWQSHYEKQLATMTTFFPIKVEIRSSQLLSFLPWQHPYC